MGEWTMGVGTGVKKTQNAVRHVAELSQILSQFYQYMMAIEQFSAINEYTQIDHMGMGWNALPSAHVLPGSR